jgi:4-amino-4-deoxy-L-arabinose transferase-like glycosyltransferase
MTKEQTNVSSTLLLSGGILVFLSLQLTQDLPVLDRGVAVIFTIIGILAFITGLWSAVSEKGYNLIEVFFSGGCKLFNIRSWQMICLIVCIPFAKLIPYASGFGQKLNSPYPALLSWVIAISLAIIGGWNVNKTTHKPGKALILGILVIFLFALIPRIFMIRTIPILLSGDEGSSGLASLKFLDGSTNNIFITSWYSFPSLFFKIQSLSILIFGRTQESLRILSAIIGSFTVVGVFLAGRTLFDKTTGLLAAIFLSASNFFIHFSRIGLNNIFDALWFTVVIGALSIGLKNNNRNSFLLAGVGMGFAQYFYPSGRILVLLVAIISIIGYIIYRLRIKLFLPNIILMFFVSIMIVLPLVWYYIKNLNEFLAPISRVWISPEWIEAQTIQTGKPVWKIILSQISLGFQAFTYTPLRAWYQSGKSLLLPFSAGLFILGLATSLFQSDRKHIVPVILWIITFGFIGSFSESTPAAQRYVAVAPACALIIGYGASRLTDIFKILIPNMKSAISAGSFLLVLFASFMELNFYFNIYTPQSQQALAHSNGMVAQRLAEFLQSQPTQQEIVFLGSPTMGFYSIPSIQFLAPGFDGIDITHPWGSSQNPIVAEKDLIFVFLPSHESQIPAIQADYPGGKIHIQYAVDKEPLYWLYEYQD